MMRKPEIVRVGVTLSALTPANQRQLDLFLNDDRERKRCELITNTIDRLNQKFGKRVVTVGPWTPPPGGYTEGKIAYNRIPSAEDFWRRRLKTSHSAIWMIPSLSRRPGYDACMCGSKAPCNYCSMYAIATFGLMRWQKTCLYQVRVSARRRVPDPHQERGYQRVRRRNAVSDNPSDQDGIRSQRSNGSTIMQLTIRRC